MASSNQNVSQVIAASVQTFSQNIAGKACYTVTQLNYIIRLEYKMPIQFVHHFVPVHCKETKNVKQ